MNDHPDVLLAIQHRDVRERREAMRERDVVSEALQRALCDLTVIVGCLNEALCAVNTDPKTREVLLENLTRIRDLEDRLS